jgi:predicted nucleic acid-binding protein
VSIILADTSVWVDHLRKGNDHFSAYLREGQIVCHPYIIGELACGNIKNRAEILSMLSALPSIQVAEHDEVMYLISEHKLHGKGIGWVDAHLLASALLAPCRIWTMNKTLHEVAELLRISK